MKTLIAVCMTLTMLTIGFVSARGEVTTEEKQTAAANEWLALVDGGDYSKSWNEASAHFRGAVTEESWDASLTSGRQPLGKPVKRRIVKIETPSSLPNAPDGSYAVLVFDAAFEHKSTAMELVTLILEKDGKWRVIGYVIR